MPSDIKQLRSLLGGLSYYRKFLPDMARRIRPITALLKKGAKFNFTPDMEDTVRSLLAELAAPSILVFPNWDATLAQLASAPPSSKSNSMAQLAPSFILVERLSPTSRTGLR